MMVPKDLAESEEFLPSTADKFRFVTPIALQVVVDASPTELPDLSIEEIRSKSKADVFTKILTCIQATWFIAQCLTRCGSTEENFTDWSANGSVVAQHIPISLLELNTFGHAVCALLIYLLWWEKPLVSTTQHSWKVGLFSSCGHLLLC